METQATAAQFAGAAFLIGFFIFLSVCVVAIIWSKTRQKLAIQETLRQLVVSEKNIDPQIVDALRQPRPKLTPAQARASAQQSLIWAIAFFVVAIAFIVLGLTVFPLNEPREFFGAVIFLLIFPGLYHLTQAIITWLVEGRGD